MTTPNNQRMKKTGGLFVSEVSSTNALHFDEGKQVTHRQRMPCTYIIARRRIGKRRHETRCAASVWGGCIVGFAMLDVKNYKR